MRQLGVEFVPQNKALGITLVHTERATAILRLPYSEKIVGNPETGALHGGAITTLLDGASGAAVFMALDQWTTIATLDLRIDYTRIAEPGRDVLCKAHCYKLARNVAFVRATAYHDSEDDPIATSAGTFMLNTKSGRPKATAT